MYDNNEIILSLGPSILQILSTGSENLQVDQIDYEGVTYPSYTGNTEEILPFYVSVGEQNNVPQGVLINFINQLADKIKY